MNKFTNLAYAYLEKFVLLYGVFILLNQCTTVEKQTENIEDYKKTFSQELYTIRNEDSLLTTLQALSEKKDDIGQMICYKHLGALQRAKARFPEAINSHKQYLGIATKLNDTIEIVEAMNNLGTNFQRMGAHIDGLKYHYQALFYADSWSGLHTSTGTKIRVMTLNKIANISLIIGHYNEAERYTREVLKYETLYENPREKAINYANLGAICKIHQEYDSARFYYQKSMEQNKIAKSNIGIGLNLLDFGMLYENEQKYELAKSEYKKAYELMDQISTKWHWLQACLSIARIHLVTNNLPRFNHYIHLAENIAYEINTPEHLATIYKLKHDYNLKQGDYISALQNYKLHKAMQDSLQGIQKANRYMDVRLGHEQTKNTLLLQEMKADNMLAQQKREYVIYLSWFILIVLLIITFLLYYAYCQRTRKNKVLRRLERTRTAFITNITHESRTPLTVIQGLNRQMMRKKDLTEQEKTAFMGAIERQSTNLLSLVNQLLDVAKLKQGTEIPEWKRGNIIAYLQMTAETFRLYAKQKGLKLLFYSHIPQCEMDFVPSYMDKIISNLLSNAIKHTDAGGKIDFIVDKGQRPDSISIRIADTGEGILEEDQKHIFDLFYQSPHTRNSSGTGIGLAFTQMMVEKMEGKIEVESKMGEGSAFLINLPLKNKKLTHISRLKEDEAPFTALSELPDPVSEIKEQPEPLEKETGNAKPLILIVEDNRDITLYLTSLLADRYKVITAWNGKDGLEIAEKSIPDLVITDVMMPLKDGYQFVYEMKQNMLINHIPVIMLTAKASDEDRLKGLRCGADAYVQKPFQHEELLVRIENIFENRRILKEKYISAVTHSESDNKLNNDANLDFLQTITNIIHSEINNPDLNSAFLADKMAMSISQLSRKINGITGYSTISYVLHLKLDKAKKMLADDSLSVAEVSDACGFYDASYFSRVFKRKFGVSPSNYQKTPTFS